ncbi:hypothetical protein HDU97_002340 [Phlyctochytrium planicorne]|nr:hypothetical protein HDU97_002340 [Phlyctochytrium planicorne]
MFSRGTIFQRKHTTFQNNINAAAGHANQNVISFEDVEAAIATTSVEVYKNTERLQTWSSFLQSYGMDLIDGAPPTSPISPSMSRSSSSNPSMQPPQQQPTPSSIMPAMQRNASSPAAPARGQSSALTPRDIAAANAAAAAAKMAPPPRAGSGLDPGSALALFRQVHQKRLDIRALEIAYADALGRLDDLNCAGKVTDPEELRKRADETHASLLLRSSQIVNASLDFEIAWVTLDRWYEAASYRQFFDNARQHVSSRIRWENPDINQFRFVHTQHVASISKIQQGEPIFNGTARLIIYTSISTTSRADQDDVIMIDALNASAGPGRFMSIFLTISDRIPNHTRHTDGFMLHIGSNSYVPENDYNVQCMKSIGHEMEGLILVK